MRRKIMFGDCKEAHTDSSLKGILNESKEEDVYYVLLQEPAIETQVYVTSKYSEFRTTVDEFLKKWTEDGSIHNHYCDPVYAYCLSNKTRAS